MKKKVFLLMLCASVLFSMVNPHIGQASEVNNISKQLQELEEQSRSAVKKQQEAKDSISSVEADKNRTEADLDLITSQIDSKMKEMAEVSKDIEQCEMSLEENGYQLEAANQRIEERSKMLDSRVQLMYMNGRASYLDVLFDATSFTDFISRMDSLEMIARTDKKMLEDHKRDKQLVIEKKQEIEAELKRVRSLYAQLDATKQTLIQKEHEKEVMIAGFDQEIEDMHGLSEEQDKLLVEIATMRSSLQQQQLEEIEKERRVREAERKQKEKQKEKQKREEEQRQREEEMNREDEQRNHEAENQESETEEETESESSSGFGMMSMPLKDDYVITSRYGSRTDPVTGKQNVFHSGLDMGAPAGTPIYAAESGIVTVAEWWGGYGNCVIIDHGGGVWTLYGHMREGGIKVSKGDMVNVGDQIGEVGTTGNSTGNHLHFEVRLNGDRVDPEPYLW
ncbi:murein hydrolase activator EnvC family protein [Paenibacillus marinisediminis]